MEVEGGNKNRAFFENALFLFPATSRGFHLVGAW